MKEAEEDVPTINTVWHRIEAHAGQVFRQMRGVEFTYRIDHGHLWPNRTNQQISRSHFAKALALVPLASTVAVQHLRGPSYIYAVLMDERIRADEW